MRETQYRSVEHRPRRRYQLLRRKLANIDLLAEQRVPGLAQVDADLVLPAGRNPALHQRARAQRFERAHVGDRVLRLLRQRPARAAKLPERAAQPIAAIRHEIGLEVARLDTAVRERQVAAFERMP